MEENVDFFSYLFFFCSFSGLMNAVDVVCVKKK